MKRKIQILSFFGVLVIGCLVNIFTKNMEKIFFIKLILFWCVIFIGSWYSLISINKFIKERYMFLKVIGMSTREIVVQILKAQYQFFIVIGYCSVVLLSFENFLTTVIILIQLLVFYIVFITSSFLLYYNKKIKIIFETILYIVLFSLFLRILYFFMYLKSNKGNLIYDLYNLLERSAVIHFYKEQKIQMILCGTFCFVIEWLLCKKLDCKVIELTSKMCIRKENQFFNLHSKRKGKYLIHICQKINIILRKRSNMISYLFIYTLNIFLFFYCKNEVSILFGSSIFFITILSTGIEAVYREDVQCRTWYILFGESFKKFFIKKYSTSIVLNILPVLLMLISICINRKGIGLGIIMLIYFFIITLYWNAYFSSIYWRMSEESTVMGFLAILFVLVIMFIPVLNIVSCIRFYKLGKRNWWYYA